MYKIFKYKWDDRHNHFWSSDWHNFHDPSWPVPIWKMRGYSSAEESQQKTLEKINERVPEEATLWYLGDGFLNSTDKQVTNWLNQVKCKDIKYLMGNHESVMYRLYKQAVFSKFGTDQIEVYPMISDIIPNVEFLGNHQEILIGKRSIVMNHFPIHSWNGMGGRKSWMLSGHSHNADKTRNPDSPINRCLDLGWDWKRGVWSFDEIEDVMSTKTFVSYDHHHGDHF